MRTYEREDYDSTKEYEDFVKKTEHNFCWSCGRTDSYRDKPSWWYVPWILERAHIVNKPRREDRRCVVILCSLCHRISHGDKFLEVPSGFELTQENMLWIKLVADPSWYDREFMQKCSVRIIPDPIEPCVAVRNEFQNRRKRWWTSMNSCLPIGIASMAIKVVVPIPSAVLSPNSRSCWQTKSRAAKKAREDASIAATHAMGGIKRNWKSASTQITIYHRMNRNRDADNILSMLKSTIDGVEQAGVIVNDCGLIHMPIIFAIDKKSPRVEIEIKKA